MRRLTLALAGLALIVCPTATAQAALVDRGFANSVAQQLATREPIALTDYAPADGTTPASAGINAAIAAAAASGRPLVAPSGGVFLVDRPILLRSGLTLSGAGATFRASPALGDNPVMRNADFENGDDRIALLGFTVDAAKGVRGNPGGMSHGIWMRGGDSTPVRNVLMRGLYVHDAPMLGVPLQNVQDALIERLHSANHGRDGLTFYWNSQRVEILGANIHDSGDDLIGLNAEDQGSNGHRLQDFLIDSPRLARQHSQGSAIALHGARRVTVRNARVERSFHAALSIGNWNRTPAEDITVDGLTAIEPGYYHSGGAGHGVEMYAAAGNRSLAGAAGVRGVRLRGLDIRRPRAQGIALFGARGAELRDIDLRGSVLGSSRYSHGRGLTARTGFIHGLRVGLNVTGTPDSGIVLGSDGDRLTGVTLDRSVVRDSGRDHPAPGIDLENIDRLRVTNGISTDRGSRKRQTWGIRAAGIGGRSAIKGNDLRGNRDGGLLLIGAGPDVEVSGNRGTVSRRRGAPIQLRAPRVQPVARGAAVLVRARCMTTCTVRTSARLRMRNRRLRLHGKARRLRARRWTVLRLRVPRRSRMKVRRDVRRRGAVRASLKIQARVRGHRRSLRRAVRVR